MTNKPIWTPIKIRLGDIEMWEDNPRMSTKAQAQRIIKSESEFGQPVPFALSPFDKNGKAKLYDGHQRVSAWLTVYGEKHIMDAMQCNRYLTDDERKKLVISLHSGATGSWNWDVLSGWDSQNLLDWGMDNNKLKDLKTDASALSNLINSETPPQDNEVILDQMEMDAINKLMKMYPNSIRKVTRGGSKYSIHLDF